MADQATIQTYDKLHSQTTTTKGTQIQNCEFCAEIAEAGKLSQPPKLSQRGKVLLGVFGAGVAGVTAVLVPFVLPGLRRVALPYIPASPAQVKNVFTALRGRSGRLLDIGSGDGRLTISAAQHSFQAEGVELNRWLVWYSRWAAWKKGIHSSKAHFFRADLWKTDLSVYKNVIIFGVEGMMPELEKKMGRELGEDVAVAACRFPLPTWQPERTIGEGIDTVWLYVTPARGKAGFSDCTNITSRQTCESSDSENDINLKTDHRISQRE